MATAASSKTIISESTSPKPVSFSHSSLLCNSSHLVTPMAGAGPEPANPYYLSVSLFSSSRLSSAFVVLNPMAGAEHNNHYSPEKLPTVYVTSKECGVVGVVSDLDAGGLCYLGLQNLEHPDLVADPSLTGAVAIGHVRYSTASAGAGDRLRRMPFIIFYLLVLLVACASAYEPTPMYQYLEIQSEDSSYDKALFYMGTLTPSEEEPAVYESLSVMTTNGSTFNLRPAQIAHDSFLGTRLTWIKASDGLLIRLRPKEHSLFLGPYLHKVISVGHEMAPAEECFLRPGVWSWGFVFNHSEKVEATLDVAVAIIGPLSARWKNRIVNVKGLYSLMVQVYRVFFS